MNVPRCKVITIDISIGAPETRDFIPELKDAIYSFNFKVKCVNKEYFVAVYKRNVIVFSLAIYFRILLTSICHPQVKYYDTPYYSKAGVQLTRLTPDFVGVASIANRNKQSHFSLTLSGFDTAGTIAQTAQVNGESSKSGMRVLKFPCSSYIVHRTNQQILRNGCRDLVC